MNRKKWIPAALLASAAFAVAQSKPELTARELFYVPAAAVSSPAPKKATTPPKPSTSGKEVASGKTTRPPVVHQQPRPQESEAPVMIQTASYSGPRPLGLRYSILKRESDGSYEEVNPDSNFHSGDKLRIRIESNEDAYLYLVARGTSGRWDVLFPQRAIRNGDNFVEASQPLIIPSSRGVWTLDERRGDEKLFLVLSRQPVADVDRLIYDLNQGSKPAAAPAPEAKKPAPTTHPATTPSEPRRTMLAQNVSPIDDALVGRLRSQMLSRDLVFEKVDDTESTTAHKKEAALYVVDKSGRPDARLVVDIKLRHE
jgi:hypothetical protein